MLLVLLLKAPKIINSLSRANRHTKPYLLFQLFPPGPQRAILGIIHHMGVYVAFQDTLMKRWRPIELLRVCYLFPKVPLCMYPEYHVLHMVVCIDWLGDVKVVESVGRLT